MRLGRFSGIVAAASLCSFVTAISVPSDASAAADTFGLGTGVTNFTASSANQVINAYAPVTSFTTNGGGQITAAVVGATVGTGAFAAGDLVLVWQPFGLAATSGDQTAIDLSASASAVGQYEYARLQTVALGTLTFTSVLINNYTASNTQVVRVPEYNNFTVSGTNSITATAYNGRTGGIVAFLAQGDVTLTAATSNIDVSGRGFRGGLQQTSNTGNATCPVAGADVAPPNAAPKGEGLTGNYALTFAGRGNSGIAGGGGNGSTIGANCHDTGGGGGGHIGAGGKGGLSVWDSLDYGGYGGTSLVYGAFSRAFMGGGAGSGRNTNNAASPGAAGGGVILFRAASMTGLGSLLANGATPAIAGQDGAGGGGAGGLILVRLTGTAVCGNARANGGTGGTTNYPMSTDHGPGGGGGGGRVLIQANGAATCTVSATGGAAGIATFSGTAHGAVAGSAGNSTGNTSPFPILSAAVTSPTAGADTSTTPTISGTCTTGTTVTVYVDSTALAGTVTCTGGMFSKTVASALSIGAHNTFAIAVDSTNNVQVQSSTVTFNVIAAPSVTLNAPSVINAANANSYTVSGTCTTAAGTVSVGVGTVTGNTACTAGTFSTNLNVSGLADGASIAVSAAQTNGGGTTTANATTSKDTVVAVPVISTPAAAAVVAPNPSITGTGEVGATVTVHEGMTAVCSGVVNGMGNWTCASTLGVGSHTITATQVDVAGNTSAASGGRTFSIPAAPVVTLNAPAVINAANAASYTVSGTCTTGQGNVSVAVGTVVATPACAAGVFTTNVNVSGLADAASIAVSASQTNVTGTGSDSETTSKDTVVAVPVISTPAAAAVVAPNPSITGTGEVGATVTVHEGMTAVCSGVVNGLGNWSCSSTLGVGSHTITATQVDVVGNTSAASGGRTFSIAPLPVVTIDAPTVINAANAASYTVSGTCTTGQGNVSVAVGTVVATPACAAGVFTTNLNVSGLADAASIVVSASQTNLTGTGSANTTTSKDTTAAPPVISTPVAAAIVAPNPTLTGTGEVGATVTVHNGLNVVCTAVVNGSGDWTCASTFGVGVHTITATQVDLAGNTSAASPGRTFVIAALPVVTIDSPPIINAGNAATYTVSGTCTTTAGAVSVSVGSVTQSPGCVAGVFTVALDVSGLADAASIAISAAQTNLTGTGNDNATTSKDTAVALPVISTPVAAAVVAPNPDLTGTGEVGATVTVSEGVTVICTAVVNGMGNWACTSTLTTGSHTVTATQVDLAGNTSAATAGRTFSIPALPVVTLDTPAIINSANMAAYTVSGTCTTAAGTVTVSVGTVTGSPACAGGIFTVNLNVSALADGAAVALSAAQTNVTGTGTVNGTTSKDTAVAAPSITSPLAAALVAPNPSISGSGEVGATVTVHEGMTVVCTGVVNAMGNWTCASTLGIGSHTVNATQVDAAGNASATSGDRTFTVAGVPAVTLNTAAVINAANAASYTVSGTCTTTAGTVSVAVGTVIGTTACTAGSFTLALNVAGLMDTGSISITASQTHVAGTGTANGATSKDTVVVAPAISSPADGATVAPNPTFTGTGEAGATVTVREGMTVVCSAVANGTGNWSCASTLAVGSHTVTAGQVDVAGNSSVASTAVSITIPAAPVVALNATPDIFSGNAAAYGVSGTCTNGAGLVTVSVGAVLAMVPCNMGAFSTTLDVTSVPDGAGLNVLASQANISGIGSENKTVNKDTVVLAPIIGSPLPNAVIAPDPTLEGSGEIGATVTVREGMTVVCTAVVNASGDWSCASTLGVGSHTITATQVDVAGNTSAASAAVGFTVPPTPAVTLDAPAKILASNVTAYPVSGTCVSGAGDVSVSVGSVNVTVPCAAGVFIAGPDVSALADGTGITISVTQSNVAGTSTKTGTTDKDATVSAPVIAAPLDGSVVALNPTFNGTGEAGATVTVTQGMSVVCTSTVDASGNWSCNSTLVAGSHTVTATQVDMAGNVSPASPAVSITILAVPLVTLTAPGPVNAANVAAYPIAGTCVTAAGAVTLTLGSVVTTVTCVANAFSTTLDVGALADVDPLVIIASQSNVSGSSTDSKSTRKDTFVAPPTFASPVNGQQVAVNPLVSGSAEPNAQVTVRNGTTVVCTVTASASGVWSCPTMLAVGPHTLTATQTDGVGNVSNPASVSFTVANVPQVTLDDPPRINAANAGVYVVKGSCTTTAGNVTLSVDSINAVAPCTAGMFAAVLNVTALPDNAPIAVTASQSNAFGTSVAAKPTGKDTVANAPVISSPVQGTTTGSNPSISGVAEPNAGVTVREGMTVVCTVVANSNGNWSCPTTLAPGPHSVTAVMTDGYGNTSAASMARDFTVGLSPTVSLNTPGTMTQANAASYPVAGACTDGSGAVSLTVGTVMASAPCVAGQFATTLDVSSLPDGANVSVSASQTDSNGTGTDVQRVLKDTTVASPTFTAPSAMSVVALNPVITGEAEPGALVTLREGMTVVCTTQADALGQFSCATSLGAGMHSLTAVQVDAVGNTSVPSPVHEFTVAPLPVITLAPLAPVNGTNVATFVVTGTCDDSAGTVSLKVGTVMSTTACMAGVFSATLDVSPTPDAAMVTVSASQTNGAGTATAQGSTAKDVAAPGAPVITAPAAPVGQNPPVSGTGEPGSTVIVREGTNQVCVATVDASGMWSCMTTLPTGTHTLTATAVDGAGNTSPASTPVEVVVTTAPTVMLGALAPINGGNASGYTVTGTCSTGSGPVTVQVGSATTMASCTNGMFSAMVDVSALPDGAQVNVSARQTNAAGSGMATGEVSKDTAPPSVPVLTSPGSGASTSTTPTFTGTAEPGATVSVFVDGVLVGTAVADANGNFSVTPSMPLPAGTHTVTASAKDPAGNQGGESPARSFTVSTMTGGNTPAIDSPTPGADLDAMVPVVITGTGTPGDTVTIYVDGEPVGTATVGEDGTWTFTIPARTLSEGEHVIGVSNGNGERNEVKVVVELHDLFLSGGGCGCSSGSGVMVSGLLALAWVLATRRRKRARA